MDMSKSGHPWMNGLVKDWASLDEWTLSKSAHPCPCQNCSQWPPAGKTGRGFLLNGSLCPPPPPTTLSVRRLDWTDNLLNASREVLNDVMEINQPLPSPPCTPLSPLITHSRPSLLFRLHSRTSEFSSKEEKKNPNFKNQLQKMGEEKRGNS